MDKVIIMIGKCERCTNY